MRAAMFVARPAITFPPTYAHVVNVPFAPRFSVFLATLARNLV